MNGFMRMAPIIVVNMQIGSYSEVKVYTVANLTSHFRSLTYLSCYSARIRDDIEQEDVEEAFYRYMEENPLAGVYMEDDEIVEYDEACLVFFDFWLTVTRNCHV